MTGAMSLKGILGSWLLPGFLCFLGFSDVTRPSVCCFVPLRPQSLAETAYRREGLSGLRISEHLSQVGKSTVLGLCRSQPIRKQSVNQEPWLGLTVKGSP